MANHKVTTMVASAFATAIATLSASSADAQEFTDAQKKMVHRRIA